MTSEQKTNAPPKPFKLMVRNAEYHSWREHSSHETLADAKAAQTALPKKPDSLLDRPPNGFWWHSEVQVSLEEIDALLTAMRADKAHITELETGITEMVTSLRRNVVLFVEIDGPVISPPVKEHIAARLCGILKRTSDS